MKESVICTLYYTLLTKLNIHPQYTNYDPYLS